MPARPDRPRPWVGIVAGALVVVAGRRRFAPFSDSETLAIPALALVLPVMLAAVLGGWRRPWSVALVAAARSRSSSSTRSGRSSPTSRDSSPSACSSPWRSSSARSSRGDRSPAHAEEQRDEIAACTSGYRRRRRARTPRRGGVDASRCSRRSTASGRPSCVRSPTICARRSSRSAACRPTCATVRSTTRRPATRLLDLVVERERAARPHRRQPAEHEPDRGRRVRARSRTGGGGRAGRALGVARLARLFEPGAARRRGAGDLPLVDVDPTQIDQVIANLARERGPPLAGRHAMRRSSAALDDEDDSMSRLTVADTGAGLDPDLRGPRCSMPYVTSGRRGVDRASG